ncbi:cyclic-phosphate processing receiver domain-containing protein [Micromonospora sp. NPDC049089]|uniref:cyclic-phosphate processing receiver domain-containing protein n=1 Tax=Micromonospora sp. NPDC049089 TaxID=3155496 RepID=UPI0033F69904
MPAEQSSWSVTPPRSFADGRSAEVARTSAAGIELLDQYRDRCLDQLWLDHDLGGDDTVWPVVEVLERATFDKCPFDVGVINVHSANSAGAAKVAQVLRHWGYRVRPSDDPASTNRRPNYALTLTSWLSQAEAMRGIARPNSAR